MSLKSFKVMSFDVVGTLIDFERGMFDYVRRSVPGTKVTEAALLDAYQQAESIVSEGSFYPNYLDKMWSVIAKTLGLSGLPGPGRRLSRLGGRLAAVRRLGRGLETAASPLLPGGHDLLPALGPEPVRAHAGLSVRRHRQLQ